jgi:hypothetical protein
MRHYASKKPEKVAVKGLGPAVTAHLAVHPAARARAKT